MYVSRKLGRANFQAKGPVWPRPLPVCPCVSFLKQIYFFLYWLGWVFLAVCEGFSSCIEQGLLLNAVRGLLPVVSSLVTEHGLKVRGLR